MIQNNNRFRLIELAKELINAIEKQIVNFPNKEMELKQNLKNSAYDILLYSYEANQTIDIDKKIDLQEKCIAKIKFIDFLINQCYDKQIINNKRYLRFGEKLENLMKYFVGWSNKTKVEKERIEKARNKVN